MKIVIDTNIYLDFYRSNNESLKIFKEIIKNSKSIILTDQIIQDFDRSRERVIKAIKVKFDTESKLDDFSSSFLQNLKEFKDLIDLQKNLRLRGDKSTT